MDPAGGGKARKTHATAASRSELAGGEFPPSPPDNPKPRQGEATLPLAIYSLPVLVRAATLPLRLDWPADLTTAFAAFTDAFAARETPDWAFLASRAVDSAGVLLAAPASDPSLARALAPVGIGHGLSRSAWVAT